MAFIEHVQRTVSRVLAREKNFGGAGNYFIIVVIIIINYYCYYCHVLLKMATSISSSNVSAIVT